MDQLSCETFVRIEVAIQPVARNNSAVRPADTPMTMGQTGLRQHFAVVGHLAMNVLGVSFGIPLNRGFSVHVKPPIASDQVTN
jgi:hypothetical protein